MEDGNLIPQEKSSHTVTIFIVVVLLIVGVLYFTNTKETNNTNNQDNSAPTVEQVKSALLKDSTYIESNTASSKTIENKALPEDLRIFLSADATNLLIRQAENSEGKAVYTISFAVNVPIRTYHQQTLSSIQAEGEFNIIKASRTSVFAFIEAENTKYSLRISETQTSESTTDILIEAQTK